MHCFYKNNVASVFTHNSYSYIPFRTILLLKGNIFYLYLQEFLNDHLYFSLTSEILNRKKIDFEDLIQGRHVCFIITQFFKFS